MSKYEIEVSIILPCFNIENFVKRAYQSILSQTIKNWEAIFVDDGSYDNTIDKLLEIKKKDNRVKIIQQKNLGSGIARNTGAAMAQGKYLYFMDPDDEIKESTLEILLNSAENMNLEMVICGYQEIDVISKNTKKFSVSNVLTTLTNEEVKNIYPVLVDNKLFNPPWNKLFLTDFWRRNSLAFPAVKKGQDALLNMIAFRYLERLAILPQNLYLYYIGRIGSAQTTLSDNDFEYFEINQKYEKKLMDFWNINTEKYFIEKKISFCFADSVKVYRYVKSRNEGLKQFTRLWNARKAKSEIKKISLLKVISNKKLFFKLLSMKIPIFNYYIQKKMIN